MKFISWCLKGRMAYGEGLGVTLFPRYCWGSLSHQKLFPGFCKHGGSSERESKGRVLGLGPAVVLGQRGRGGVRASLGRDAG